MSALVMRSPLSQQQLPLQQELKVQKMMMEVERREAIVRELRGIKGTATADRHLG